MKPAIFIDDDIDVLETFKELFEAFGFDHLVEFLQGGREFSSSLFENRTLVMTDLMMPVETGVDVAKKVKKTNPSAHIWVISGNIDRATEQKLNSIDIDDIISKPVDIDLFMEKFKTQLGQ